MLRVFRRNARPRRLAFRPLAECLEVRKCPSGGLLDPSFNGGAPETSSFFDLASATAIQPDGKLVVVGGSRWIPSDKIPT
jgi:hypothetical protein